MDARAWSESTHVPDSLCVLGSQAIVLTAPGMDDLHVPILHASHGETAHATVWGSKVVAVDQGDEAATWINAYLADVRHDRTFRFLRVSDAFKRVTDPKYAPNYETGTPLTWS